MHRNTTNPVPALIHASARLLRQRPTLWATGFLVGVLAALLLSTQASTWEGTAWLQVLLAVGLVGLAFPLSWVGLELARQLLAVRQRQLAALEERAEE